jgi:hypothetical protein
MLPLIAGIISSLISANLPKVADAVVNKGLDYVQDKLGITLEPQMSPEKLAEIAQRANEHEEFLVKEANANTASAREMNTHIQTSEFSSKLAQNAAYILDFIIVSAAITVSWLAFFKGVPAENKELVYMGIGSLWTMAGTIINFHRGTSSSNKTKDDAINKLSSRVR